MDYITIEGNIGAGKTTLSKMLAKDLEYDLCLEEFEENPFLIEFLKNQKNNSFAVEMQFLIDRYHQLLKYKKSKKLISDYIPNKSKLFATNNLTIHEKILFDNYYNILFEKIKKPDNIIYLNISPKRLLENINERGREYEFSINEGYLTNIHNQYINYFNEIKSANKIILIDCSDVNFVLDNDIYIKIKNIILNNKNIGISHVKI